MTTESAFRGVGDVTSYLNQFGPILAARIRSQFNPLYDPESEQLTKAVCSVNAHIHEKTGYSLFNAQLASAEAIKRRLQSSEFALLIAECGSGKSKIGSTALEAYQSQTDSKRLNIILCPSHIADKWVRDRGETIDNDCTYQTMKQELAYALPRKRLQYRCPEELFDTQLDRIYRCHE